MSDPTEATTPSADEVQPSSDDPVDPAELQSAGDLDEDQLGFDPVEGVQPPEQWSPVAEERPTPREEHEGNTLEERLAEERPETDGAEARPLAEVREQELDDTVDERADAEVADEFGEAAERRY